MQLNAASAKRFWISQDILERERTDGRRALHAALSWMATFDQGERVCFKACCSDQGCPVRTEVLKADGFGVHEARGETMIFLTWTASCVGSPRCMIQGLMRQVEDSIVLGRVTAPLQWCVKHAFRALTFANDDVWGHSAFAMCKKLGSARVQCFDRVISVDKKLFLVSLKDFSSAKKLCRVVLPSAGEGEGWEEAFQNWSLSTLEHEQHAHSDSVRTYDIFR